MAISDELKRALVRRSGGQCECDWPGCRHHEPRRRCPNMLYGDGWKTLRRLKKGPENLRNVIAVCAGCHKHQSVARV